MVHLNNGFKQSIFTLERLTTVSKVFYAKDLKSIFFLDISQGCFVYEFGMTTNNQNEVNYSLTFLQKLDFEEPFTNDPIILWLGDQTSN